MREKFLPIGSVVLLNNGERQLMITGYSMQTPDSPNKIYDYCGCIFPEGVLNSQLTCVFDHSKIKEIVFIGYESEECKEFLNFLNPKETTEEGEVASSQEQEVIEETSIPPVIPTAQPAE